MTQKDRILNYMRMNGKLCSLQPLEWNPRITRTAARIHDLEAEGWEIESTPCRMHTETTHHVAYELRDEGRLFA